mmetsp:Transcript_46939/g.102052  ORF Transcript_46939/g.102052 Transcript_46939/m.102052 type:complete len:216 (-) Transcript_46939:2790-3437(-)
MAQIKGCINLIEDVHRSWLEKEERQHQGEGQKRPLSAAELRQGLLPDPVESDLDLQALGLIHTLRRLELGAGLRQKRAEDGVEVLVHLEPGSSKSITLLLIQVFDDLFNSPLVIQDDVALLEEVSVLLLCLLEERHCLLVDALDQGLLLSSDVFKAPLGLLVVVRLKVEVCAHLAKETPLFLDPCMLLLHSCSHRARLLVVLLELLNFVAAPLEL